MDGLGLIAAHLVGDFVLQTEYMAVNKLHNVNVRVYHVTVYCLPFLIWFIFERIPLWEIVQFVLLLWVLHFIVDSRRWASGEKWPPKPILIDQSLHIVSLAILQRVLM